MEQNMIERNEAEKDVLIMADRMASLYYFMVRNIIKETDEATAEKIVKKAILEYGLDCGEKAREKVLSLGKEVTLANYYLGKDLPSLGWKKEKISMPSSNEKASKVLYCPLAVKWKERDFEKWGRMYCFVDQAKYQGYCSGMKCYHDKNVLDGDDCCVVRIVTEAPLEENK